MNEETPKLNSDAIGGSVQRSVRWLNPMRHWRQRLRNIDHKILFPAIRRQAKTEMQAAQAIVCHCVNDHAWECNPEEYSKRDTEVIVECAKLLPPNGMIGTNSKAKDKPE